MFSRILSSLTSPAKTDREETDNATKARRVQKAVSHSPSCPKSPPRAQHCNFTPPQYPSPPLQQRHISPPIPRHRSRSASTKKSNSPNVSALYRANDVDSAMMAYGARSLSSSREFGPVSHQLSEQRLATNNAESEVCGVARQLSRRDRKLQVGAKSTPISSSKGLTNSNNSNRRNPTPGARSPSRRQMTIRHKERLDSGAFSSTPVGLRLARLETEAEERASNYNRTLVVTNDFSDENITAREGWHREFSSRRQVLFGEVPQCSPARGCAGGRRGVRQIFKQNAR